MIRIRFFAGAAAAAGMDEAVCEFAGDRSVRATAASVVPHSIDEVLAVSSFLVNGELTPGDDVLPAPQVPDSEILIDVLPPFAGG